jgi:hypothetical protein
MTFVTTNWQKPADELNFETDVQVKFDVHVPCELFW